MAEMHPHRSMSSAVAGLLIVALAGPGLTTPAALAQEGRQMIVMEQDDGDGEPVVMQFSLPDLETLREPDYLRSDLPVFERRLALTEPQREVVRGQIEAYLEAFELLMVEAFPRGGPMMLRLGGPTGPGGQARGPGGDGPGLGLVIDDALGEGLDAETVDVIGGEGGQIMVAITAGVPIGEGGAGDPAGAGAVEGSAGGADGEPSVVIALGGPDDAELSDEARAKLEARAKEMAEQIRERLAEAEARGENPFPGGPGGMSIEEHMDHMEQLNADAETFADAKAKLGRQFVTDVQTGLEDDQIERWPSLERALTRHKRLPKGRLDGEKTDLVAVVDDLGLDPDAMKSLDEPLEQYELLLHDALVRRDAFLADAQPQIDQAVQTRDFQKAQRLADRASRLRVGVRDVNDEFTLRIAEGLDEDMAARFRHDIRREAFPRAWSRTRAERAFEQARKLLADDEQRLLAILELEYPFREQLDLLNARIERAIRRHQPEEARRGLETVAAMMAGEAPPDGPPDMAFEFGNEDDPVRALMLERRELMITWMNRLYASLDPGVVEQLPKIPSARPRPVIIRSGPEITLPGDR